MSAKEFFSVAFRRQTHKNILYLLFSFPLGTAYFIFLITGLSLGFRFLMMWVGIPLLAIVFLAWWEIASFERQMAVWLLGIDIPVTSLTPLVQLSVLERAIFRIKDPATWKALLFLLAKFPIGIISFAVMISLMVLTVAMLANPLIYLSGKGPANTLLEAFILSFAGIITGLISLHILNLLAYAEGYFAQKMLGCCDITGADRPYYDNYIVDLE